MIFVSFADIKQKNYKDAITKIKSIIEEVYHQFYLVCDDDILSEQEKKSFGSKNAGKDLLSEAYKF